MLASGLSPEDSNGRRMVGSDSRLACGCRLDHVGSLQPVGSCPVGTRCYQIAGWPE